MSYGKNCECSSCRNDGIDEETKTVILKDGTKAKYCIECIKESLEIKVNIHCQKCEHDIMDKETNSDILEKRKCACGNEYMIKISLIKKGVKNV